MEGLGVVPRGFAAFVSVFLPQPLQFDLQLLYFKLFFLDVDFGLILLSLLLPPRDDCRKYEADQSSARSEQ